MIVTLPPSPVAFDSATKAPPSAPVASINSEAVIVISPASPCPEVEAEISAPSLTLKVDVLIVTLPPFPVAFDLTSAKIPLPPPVASINSEAVIVKLPAFPCPEVETKISALSLIRRVDVLIVTLPPSPVAFDSATKTPSRAPVASINSEAVIVKLPAFPDPKVETEISASSLTLRLAVSIVTLPPSPVAPEFILFSTRLPTSAIVIFPKAFSLISPACAVVEPKFSLIPAEISLPPEISKLLALTVTKPPSEEATSTKASSVNDIFPLAIPSGKVKLPSALMPISPAADNPPISTLPPGAVIFPPSKLMSPPSKARVSPVSTFNPTSSATD